VDEDDDRVRAPAFRAVDVEARQVPVDSGDLDIRYVLRNDDVIGSRPGPASRQQQRDNQRNGADRPNVTPDEPRYRFIFDTARIAVLPNQ